MKIECALFFYIEDLIHFNNEIFHNNDVLEINNFIDYKYKYTLVDNKEKVFTYNKPRVISLIEHEAYMYKQKDNLVVYKCNSDDNWYVRINKLGIKYKYECLNICVDDEKPYPCFMIRYYKGGNKRVIYSMKDGERWVFYQGGEQQPFEMNDLYNERGPTKKFNYKKLKFFCSNLGFDIDDPDFFTPVGDIIYTTVQKK